MAKATLSLPVLLLFLLLLLLNSEGSLKLANAQEADDTWCIAKPSSSDAELAANIHFSCDQVPDCRLIQEGGSCFLPNTLLNHASVVMNLYYKMMGKNDWNCNFRSSGILTLNDPSYGSCTYA